MTTSDLRYTRSLEWQRRLLARFLPRRIPTLAMYVGVEEPTPVAQIVCVVMIPIAPEQQLWETIL